MRIKSSILVLILLFLSVIIFSAFKRIENTTTGQEFNKTLTNDVYAFIAINQIFLWISNNGDGSKDPNSTGGGFFWPGGANATQSAIFEDGLIWGGKIGRETRVNGNTHVQGLQAGKILENGDAADAADPRYRVYKIRKGFENLPPGPEKDAFQQDYDQWPVEDGAPWVDSDGDGMFTRGVDEPEFIGDEVLWYVANDLDEARSTTAYGTAPIGLEFQTTIFGFNRSGDLGDIVFKKYLMINKGQNTLKDFVVGYWSDTDLGNAGDDYTACDTALSLGYTYNDDDFDSVYDAPVPAVGYDFFQGPIVESPGDTAKFLAKPKPGYKNLGLTAFTLYINSSSTYSDPKQGQAQGSIEFYNYLTGLVWNGNPFIDPNTGQTVNFTVPGDPVAGTGWNERTGWPGGPASGDRRHLMASGTERNTATGELQNSLTLAPGDSQEIVIGIIIARGRDFLDSVTELKRKDFAAQTAFDLDFQLTQAPPPPVAYGVASDRDIRLYWEDNAESYDEFDALLSGAKDDAGDPIEDSTYTFQGYRVWQFADETGTDRTLIGIFDVTDFDEDGLPFTTIYDNLVINGINTQVPVINGDNLGIKRFLRVSQNALTGGPLRNGTPYYFAVTAYGYSPNSIPSYLENPPVIFEIRPETKRIDVSYDHELDDALIGERVSGDGDGVLRFQIADPDILTGHTYMAYVSGTEDTGDLSWTLIDDDMGDTLVHNESYFAFDEDTVKFFDGFNVLLQNQGRDSIDGVPGAINYAVKSVLEIANGDGVLDVPVDVAHGMNSTNAWSIQSYGSLSDRRQNMNWADNVGFDNYEIRFTDSGSEYYLSGYQFGLQEPVLKNEVKSTARVPFEIWNIGRDIESAADDIRLAVKIRDENKADPTLAITDSVWTQLENDDWEPVYGFFQDSNYVEPIPDLSGRSAKDVHPIGRITFNGDIPETGTIIRINTWKPIQQGDIWKITATAPNLDNKVEAKNNLDMISVFPNPYFGANALERDKYQKFVRFTNLPSKVTVRIYSIAGVFVNKLEKDDPSQWLDWNLLNIDNLPVATGIYIAHLDMPGVGEKIMKIAFIAEKQIIDRL